MELNIVIDRFEGNKAVLKIGGDETVLWPADKLPQGSHEGMILNFHINGDAKKEKDEKSLAKKILNEILGNDET